MGMKLNRATLDNPENRKAMAVGSVYPLDILGWSQHGTTQGDLTLAYLDSITAKNNEPLRELVVVEYLPDWGAHLSLARMQQHTAIVSLLVVFLVWPEGGVDDCPFFDHRCSIRGQISQVVGLDNGVKLTLAPEWFHSDLAQHQAQERGGLLGQTGLRKGWISLQGIWP